MKTFEIRAYTEKDWAAVAAIHDAARLQELYRCGKPEAYLPLEDTAKKQGFFEENLFVAEVDGSVRGFVAFTVGEITHLYVNPLFARQGIGTALARYAAVCHGGERVAAAVLAGNDPALALFEKLGFAESGAETAPLRDNPRYKAKMHRLAHTGEVSLF